MKIVVTTIFLLYDQVSLAAPQPIDGPKIRSEATQRSAIKDQDGSKRPVKEATNRWHVDLFLPLRLLNSYLVPQLQLIEETKRQTINLQPNKTELYREMIQGVIVVPDLKLDHLQLFSSVARYGSFLLEAAKKPMVEYILGCDVNDLVVFKPQAAVVSKITMAVRHRHYPGNRVQYLPIFGYKTIANNGMVFDALYPSHAYLGWHDAKFQWFISAAFKTDSREYPAEKDGSNIWIDGHVRTVYVSMRREVFSPVHFGIEAGMMQDHIRSYDEQGERLDYYIKDWAPWYQISLQTVFLSE